MPKFYASVLHGAKDVRLEKRLINQPGPLELQIAIKATGFCGSDIHYYKHGRNGNFALTAPLVLGHESAGIVVGIGADLVSTKQWNIGDKVALEVGIPCEKDTCNQCASGRYNICPRLRFKSSCKKIEGRMYDGTLQGLINHPARWCHKLNDGLDITEAALLEPLCVAIHALERAKMQSNAICLVLGAGSIGLMVSAVCLAQGAKKVLIADVDAGRISFALGNFFATDGYVVPMTPQSENPAERLKASEDLSVILKENAGIDIQGGFDRIFECTGVESCVQTSIFAAKPGGMVLPIGMGAPDLFLPLSTAACREVDLIFVFRYAHDYPKAIKLMESGAIPQLNNIITQKFVGLDKGSEALEMAAKTRDLNGNLVVKVVLQTSSEDILEI